MHLRMSMLQIVKKMISQALEDFFKSMSFAAPAGANQVQEIVQDPNQPKQPSFYDIIMQKGKDTMSNLPSVDWDFINTLEGSSSKGYVPKDAKGNIFGQSGVTIGSGVDLGQHSEEDFKKMGVDPDLIQKLSPYFGKKKQAALNFLSSNPLRLSDSELNHLNTKVKEHSLQSLITRFNNDSKVPFDKLTDKQRTVVASLSFQYGDLAKKTPNFWKLITQNKWDDAAKSLLNFGDNYATRRQKEAEYLAKNAQV